MLHFQSNMIRAGAVTALARDANDQTLSVVPICARIVGKRSDECRVAFQTCRIYDAGKVCRPVHVAWAVDPSMSVGPITHWQLEESVSLPVQVGLTSYSGSGDKIDAFRSLKNVGVPSAPRRLEKAIPCLLYTSDAADDL